MTKDMLVSLRSSSLVSRGCLNCLSTCSRYFLQWKSITLVATSFEHIYVVCFHIETCLSKISKFAFLVLSANSNPPSLIFQRRLRKTNFVQVTLITVNQIMMMYYCCPVLDFFARRVMRSQSRKEKGDQRTPFSSRLVCLLSRRKHLKCITISDKHSRLGQRFTILSGDKAGVMCGLWPGAL